MGRWVGRAALVGLCLVLSGCSNGEEDRRADCAKISSALSATADPSAEQVLDALRRVRPALKDDDLADQVDTVIASGAKDIASGGKDVGSDGGSDGGEKMSPEETLRFAEAAERIRETCAASA